MSMEALRAVSYNRVSTEEEKQLNALSKQIQENRDVIRRMGWQFAGEYIDEGKSGTQTKSRTGYNQLYKDIQSNHFDIVVIKDQDRLMRNPKDWYLFIDNLVKNNKKLYIHLDNTFYNSDNGLITGIKAILAEEYSRHLSRKVSSAHRNRQEKGASVIITNQTWGYLKLADGTVIIDEQERGIIELIFQMYAKGIGSRKICKALTDKGIRNRKGNVLAESQIRAIVRNPLYMGTVVMNKTHINFDTKKKEKVPKDQWKYHENMVPSIVSKELWNAANRTVNQNMKNSEDRNVGQKKGYHLLSGKVSCGECGHSFWRNRRNIRRKNGLGEKVVYWYCSEYYRYGKRDERQKKGQGSGCNSLRLKEEELFGVLQKIGDSVLDKETKEGLLQNILDKICAILEDADSENRLQNLWTEKEGLIGKKERMMDLLIDGILSKRDYQKRFEEITSRLREIGELETRYTQCMQTGESQENIRNRVGRVREILEEQPHDLSIPVMASHVNQIKIFNSNIDIYFDFEASKMRFQVAKHIAAT